MANPQLENGYTKIANEILEAFISNKFSGQELRIILLIIRKTYGYHKKNDFISLSQIAKAIGADKIRCCQVVKKLELMKILTVNENINGIGKSYIFNKDFDKWQGVNKNINGLEKYKGGVNKNINLGVNKNINHKRKDIQKISLQKKESSIKKFDADSIEIKLSLLLFELIKERNPDHKKPNLQKWAEHIDLMIRRDKRDPEKIAYIIRWCQSDNVPDKRGFCWANNILSTKKLRVQYDQLVLKMMEKEGSKNKSRFTPGAIDYLRKKGVFDEE